VTRLPELERRLQEEPENLDLKVAVARALREAGRGADAVDLYRSVALAYREQGRAREAIAACRGLLEIAPDDTRCRALLAAIAAGSAGAPPEEERVARKLPLPADAVAVPRTRTPPPAALAEPLPEPPPGGGSLDETPLPPAMPHHVADPTLRTRRISESELPAVEGAVTRPGSEDSTPPAISGIANAARRISATLIGARIRADAEISVEIEPDEPGELDDSDDSDEVTEVPGEPGADPAPWERGDFDDDQTRPRELPMGIQRARPASRGPAGPGGGLGGAVTPAPLAFSFFAPLPVERRGAVLARFSRRSVPPGTVLIRQGEQGPSFVIVASGRLEVRVDRAGAPIALGAIGPGDHIGEVPLLARAPARASVIAATEAELLLLSPRDFYDIAGTFPALWAALKEIAERRTREHDARLA